MGKSKSRSWTWHFDQPVDAVWPIMSDTARFNEAAKLPRHEIEEDVPEAAPSPLPPLTPIERRAFDYTALEEAMAHLDAVVRTSRLALRSIVDGTHGAAGNPSPNRAETAADC